MRKIGLLLLFSLPVIFSACGPGSGGGGDAVAHTAADCGDTAGPSGQDVPCFCGDTVVTNTVLSSGDPVSVGACAADGLSLAEGITLDLGGLTLKGSRMGSGISPTGGATITNGYVNEFNVGVLIQPGSSLIMNGLRILNNSGIGMDVKGQLTANNVEVGSNGSYGMRIETAAPVNLINCFIHDNGQAGAYTLAASHESGFVLSGSRVIDNGGDGIVLGDLTAQTGIVNAHISDVEITGNQTGISVAQANSTTLSTHHRILANNIYSNRQSGLYIRTSYQWYMDITDRRAMSANDVHHNAVEGAGCSLATGATQTAPQIVFDGPIATADPTVPNIGPVIGPDPAEYPEDYRCFWGPNNNGQILTATDCNNLNNPLELASGGINNNCGWHPGLSQCRLAWQAGGTEGTGTCDSSRNRIFAYVNDPTRSLLTRGVVAINGALVNARRNDWGVGGALDGISTDVGFGSIVNAENECGFIANCLYKGTTISSNNR